MATKLLFPDDIVAFLKKRYANQHRNWLIGGGAWPLSVSVGGLTERQAATDATRVRQWVEAWSRWGGSGELKWHDIQWPKMGRQRLPYTLNLASALDVARVVGDDAGFQTATARYEDFARQWGVFRGASVVAKHFDVFSGYREVEFRRLVDLLSWLLDNPRSGHFLRQLPVEGLDTKWVDAGRRALISDLLRAARGAEGSGDFHTLCGLRRPPHRVRMAVLCPQLRRAISGLRDVEAPISEIASLPLSPACVLVVENLESGLALPDIAGCVAFMKLGASVSSLAEVGWLAGKPVVYWGDIDTHGIAILDRARAALGMVTSVLMDEATLLAHRRLWGEEPSQHVAADLPNLSESERSVYENLRANKWGRSLRLEQERIPWAEALVVVSHACEVMVASTGNGRAPEPATTGAGA